MSKFPDISNLRAKLLKEINDIKSLDQLDNIRVSALGKKGAITSLLKNISSQTINQEGKLFILVVLGKVSLGTGYLRNFPQKMY